MWFTLALIAQGEVAPALDWSQWGLAGVLIGVLIALGTTWIRAERARADRWEKEAIRLNSLIQEKHIPALDEARHVIADAMQLIRDMRKVP